MIPPFFDCFLNSVLELYTKQIDMSTYFLKYMLFKTYFFANFMQSLKNAKKQQKTKNLCQKFCDTCVDTLINFFVLCLTVINLLI